MLDNDFMLKGKTAKLLYNDIAKNAPIYDYHCHLSAKEIFEYINLGLSSRDRYIENHKENKGKY